MILPWDFSLHDPARKAEGDHFDFIHELYIYLWVYPALGPRRQFCKKKKKKKSLIFKSWQHSEEAICFFFNANHSMEQSQGSGVKVGSQETIRKNHSAKSRVSCQALPVWCWPQSSAGWESGGGSPHLWTHFWPSLLRKRKDGTSGFSRETDSVGYRVMYERRFIVRNGLLGDGAWDRPCSAVCKLEVQGLEAYRGPKEGQLGVSPGGQGQGPGAPIPTSEGRRDGCLSSRRERIHPSSTFSHCYTPHWVGWCQPAHVGEDESILLSLQSQAQILSGNTLNRHNQK